MSHEIKKYKGSVIMQPTKKIKSNHIILFLGLFGFWLIISSSFHWFSLFLGLISSALITWYNKDFLSKQDMAGWLTPNKLGLWIRCIFYLLRDIIVANIQVAKIVLSPDLPIAPEMLWIPAKSDSDFYKVMYGNAITLTPGTLTVDLTEDQYLIHALTHQAALDLTNSTVEKLLLEIEGVAHD